METIGVLTIVQKSPLQSRNSNFVPGTVVVVIVVVFLPGPVGELRCRWVPLFAPEEV